MVHQFYDSATERTFRRDKRNDFVLSIRLKNNHLGEIGDIEKPYSFHLEKTIGQAPRFAKKQKQHILNVDHLRSVIISMGLEMRLRRLYISTAISRIELRLSLSDCISPDLI